ncbi:MAG: LPS assembly lipoprotein LptE [Agitococcus sp.]
MKVGNSVLCSLMIISLTACGFHLRGSYHIPPQLQQLNVELSTASPLNSPLNQRLQQSGIQLNQGEYRLVILEDKLSKQTTNTDSRAKAAEYSLYYQVRYVLQNTEKQNVSEERKLLLRRSYQYDTTAIVGKTAEEETLIKELYEEAATQITRQLSGFSHLSTTKTTP